MAKKNEINPGDDWAYRISAADPFTRVEVIALSPTRPTQVEVVFPTGDHIGMKRDVPITRLKVRWEDRASFLEREVQWRALVAEPAEIEEEAAASIAREFLWPAASVNQEKAHRGTIAIYDEDIVDAVIGGGLGDILAGRQFVREVDGSLNYEWSVAIELCQRLAGRKPEQVMAYVHAEEAQARPDVSRSRREEFDAAYYDEFLRPLLNLIRSWCGEATADVHDEVRSLRTEVFRLTKFFDGAIALLADAGDTASSWALYRTANPGASEIAWRRLVDPDNTRRDEWRSTLP